MGYYGVLVGLQHSNAQRLVSALDHNRYSLQQEVHSKQVVKGYTNQSEKYQRINGEFEQNGSLYRLIRQRIYMDTFHVVYIKDIRGTAINVALKDYAASFGSQPTDGGEDTYVLPLFMKEYCVRAFHVDRESPGWIADIHPSPGQSLFIPSFVPSIVHPPERVS